LTSIYQEKGIAKLLSKLNINKASGPDTISCRILREAADEIAPYMYLKFIFEKSLELESHVGNRLIYCEFPDVP
jgi:N-acetylglucosamine kinase-like BadF-type ATPase